MTTLYVDNNNGNDSTGDGTQAKPYKTYTKAYNTLGGNGQHTIRLACGSQELLSASVSMRSGTSDSARSVLEAWGFGPKPVLRASAAFAFGVMWHLAGSQFKTINDIVFDGNGLAKYGVQIYSASTAITDIVHNRCEFKNTSMVNSGQAALTQTETAFPLASGIKFNYCKFSGSSQHGAHAFGNVQVEYYKCEAFGNGLFDATGGHGFSSYCGLITTVSSGWTVVSGTIYSRAITTPVWHVQRTSGGAQALKQNTSTPTTPASGEWGQSGGNLYINLGADPSGVSVKFSQWAPTVVYRYCTSHHNIAVDAPKAEGTGFQADDFTGSFTAIGCIAYSNDGPGFFLNQGAGAVIRDCVAYDNGNFGFAGQYYAGAAIDNITSVNNCLANRTGYNGDVKFQLGSRDIAIRNSVVQKGDSIIATASIRFDADSQVGVSLTDVVYFGAPMSVGSITQTRVRNLDPKLTANRRPLPNSPLLAAGTHLGYRRDVHGRQRHKPPSIGAYDTPTIRTRLA